MYPTYCLMRLTNIYKALVKFHNIDYLVYLTASWRKIIISITVKSETLSQIKKRRKWTNYQPEKIIIHVYT